MDIADLVSQSQALKIPAYLQSTVDLRNRAVAQNKASEVCDHLVTSSRLWALLLFLQLSKLSFSCTSIAISKGSSDVQCWSHLIHLFTPYCMKITTHWIKYLKGPFGMQNFCFPAIFEPVQNSPFTMQEFRAWLKACCYLPANPRECQAWALSFSKVGHLAGSAWGGNLMLSIALRAGEHPAMWRRRNVMTLFQPRLSYRTLPAAALL